MAEPITLTVDDVENMEPERIVSAFAHQQEMLEARQERIDSLTDTIDTLRENLDRRTERLSDAMSEASLLRKHLVVAEREINRRDASLSFIAMKNIQIQAKGEGVVLDILSKDAVSSTPSDPKITATADYAQGTGGATQL